MKLLPLYSISTIAAVLAACVSMDYYELGDKSNGVATSKANYQAYLKTNGNITKAYFCNGSKPARVLKYRISASLPSVPQNTDLESAQKIKMNYVKESRSIAQQIFYITSKAYNRPGGWMYYPTDEVYDGAHIADLIKRRTDSYFLQDLVVVHSTKTNMMHIVPRVFGERGFTPKYGLENSLLTANFSMLIPKNIQQQLFPDSRHGFVGFDNPYSESISIKDAVDRKNQLWENYFINLTNVAETSKTADTVEFESTLDLSTFCQYGQSLKDLRAK